MRGTARPAPSTASGQSAGSLGSGREQFNRALAELPALLALGEQFSATQPLTGARIAVLCPATGPVAALLEILIRLGAEIRWAASGVADDAVVSAARGAGWPVFASTSDSLEAHLDAIHQVLEWPNGSTPNLLIDTDGELARLIHLGVGAEAGAMPSPTDDAEAAVCRSIRRRLAVRPSSYSTLATNIVGLSECTAHGAERLRQIENTGGLMFPAIDASSSGFPGRTPDRSRIATHTLEGLLARQALAQIELFSSRLAYPPGMHRFPARLNQILSGFDTPAEMTDLPAHDSTKEALEDQHDALSNSHRS